MPGKRLSQGTAGHARPWKFFIFGLLLAGLAGCQEDSGASRAASSQANEVSAKRLDNAVSSFRDTLGQSGERYGSAGQDSLATPPTLRWEAPLTREDGSRLYSSDISGYRIYYRLRHEDDFDVIPLPGSAATEYPLEDFPPGAYEFSITTLDDNGLESRRSDAVVVDLI
ncbi:fibronectin type III domain-containing protein [Marinobacter sp. TBZ242]|uniref:Fibronectin type III domain-containing protein n=1 Tax=Marinobacter azerbaijanicus TaxID=3050455 RepID=A0ABT7IE51_9GAMM|nr:fibronectin type III domain-containing protein [Marinobacter sp. TBZ242]MDL0432431.1 fibronectin type III domain-containing protein [Marinobacter sp. TBZ242]